MMKKYQIIILVMIFMVKEIGKRDRKSNKRKRKIKNKKRNKIDLVRK